MLKRYGSDIESLLVTISSSKGWAVCNTCFQRKPSLFPQANAFRSLLSNDALYGSLLECAVAMQGDLTAALECLLSLEKQHRLGEDITATKLCCTAILDALFEAKEWKLLNEHILLLAKRRSQLKQVGPSWAPGCHSAEERLSGFLRLYGCAILRRLCLLQAVQAFVRQAMGYIDQTPDKETRIELIKTLQTVTEGKVRVNSG